MTLSNEIQTFLVSQIEYYTKEAKSYKEMAREYNIDDNLAHDTAFGIIVAVSTRVLFKHLQIKTVFQTHKIWKILLK